MRRRATARWALVFSAASVGAVGCEPGPSGADAARADTPAADVATDASAVDVFMDASAVDADATNGDAGADLPPSEVVEPPADVGPDADVPVVDAGPPSFAAAEVAVGLEWTCARTTTGEVRCWGEGTHGTLGDGARVSRPRSEPVIAEAGDGVLAGAGAVETGYDRRVFARMGDGTLRFWGGPAAPAMEGVPTVYVTRPTALALADVAEVAVGIQFACARLTDGGARCWGWANNANYYGQLGDGTNALHTSPAPVLQGGAPLTGVAQVVTGHHFGCARMVAGTILCWGSNESGQLGDGSATGTGRRRATPGPVAGIADAVELVAGHLHACARLAGGAVRCWGSNGAGQLGVGATSPLSATPVAVAELADVAQLTAEGDSFSNGVTCARLGDGTARCWGYNARGALGDGTTTNRAAPTTVLRPDGAGPLTGVRQIVTGGLHTCAVVAGGEVLCWGRNASGQLGDGTTANRALPVPAR